MEGGAETGTDGCEEGAEAAVKADAPENGSEASSEPDAPAGGYGAASDASGNGAPAEPAGPEDRAAQASFVRREVLFYLNGSQLRLPRKADGEPYYLMDMLQYSGIDLRNPGGDIKLTVNGRPGLFQQKLSEGDTIYIGEGT